MRVEAIAHKPRAPSASGERPCIVGSGAGAPALLAGRYRIEGLLGRGGSAEVYAGTLLAEGGFERKVAIKLVHPGFPVDGHVSRAFQEEARIAARMSHPNLVGVLDTGIDNGQRFLVMELVEGVDLLTLRDKAAALERPMPPELALHVVLEVALGLAHAHGVSTEAGTPVDLVHRDVSPRNVLAGWNGAIKLTDFGIARWNGRSGESTPSGAFRGTVLYAAPERLLGLPGDARSDVFSLGCLLHFLAVGRSPQANKAALVEFGAGRAPLPIDETIAPELRTIIARATQREPGARYPSALALAEEASQLLSRRRRDRHLELLAWLDLVRRGVPLRADEAPVEPPRGEAAKEAQAPKVSPPRTPIDDEVTVALAFMGMMVILFLAVLFGTGP
jgi:serine/threonine protein kinase